MLKLLQLLKLLKSYDLLKLIDIELIDWLGD